VTVNAHLLMVAAAIVGAVGIVVAFRAAVVDLRDNQDKFSQDKFISHIRWQSLWATLAALACCVGVGFVTLQAWFG